MAGSEGVHWEGFRGVAVKTKNIAISALLICFTTVLEVFDVANIPVGFTVLIFFYPLLNEYFMGYFIITTIKSIWKGAMFYSQSIIAIKPMLTDPDMAFIHAWSDPQLMVFGALYLTVLWLITGATLMNTLSKLGYYKRIGGLLL